MITRVFDIEASGLEDVKNVWCYVSQDIETGETYQTDITSKNMSQNITLDLMGVDLLIGHNIKRYDLPVLESVLGVTYKGEIFDTLLMSRLLQQDRLGGHSLAAWAKRLGREKQEHDDWDNYSPEMLGRCRTDVEINVLIYHALLKEMRE